LKNTLVKFALMLVMLLPAVGCGSVSPDPGYEAVLVSKPWFFGHGGVDPTPIKTGLSYVALSTSGVYVNMQPSLFHVQFQDLMSRDGVPLDFDASARIQINDSVKLVDKYGAEGWFERNLEQPIRAMVRDAVKKHGLNEMAIDASAADSVDDEVTKAIDALIARDTFPVKLLDFTLGRANPPDSIENQRVETAAQQQRIQTEQQKTLAENARAKNETARAAADNAYNSAIRDAMHLTPEQFLDLEAIKAMREVCKGGGCTFITNGPLPTFGIRK